MKWDPHGSFMGHRTQCIHKGIIPVEQCLFDTMVSWSVNHRTVYWKESQPVPILQMRQLRPFPASSEWNTGRTASFKSENEEHLLRKGLGHQWLPWAVVSALGCPHLDLVFREKKTHAFGLVTRAGSLSRAANILLTDTATFTHCYPPAEI